MNVGDQVQLNSGGPIMTVESMEGSYVTCIWFDSKGNPQSKDFLAATVKPYVERVPTIG